MGFLDLPSLKSITDDVCDAQGVGHNRRCGGDAAGGGHETAVGDVEVFHVVGSAGWIQYGA